MRKIYTAISIFILLVFFTADVKATHLIGGTMEYAFVSQTASTQTYRVKLVLYRDAGASATAFDPDITLAIHNNDLTKSLYNTITIVKNSEINVTPPLAGTGCASVPNVSIRQAIYEANIVVANSVNGYHLHWVRCCRVSNQVNVVDNMGQTYSAFIPPTSFRNNSPVFVGVPTPFICVNDQAQVSNAATDPDGDSLVYSIEVPYTGANNANPNPYNAGGGGVPANLSLPYPNVTYKPGFNSSQPFGIGGIATITSNTGLCEFKALFIGVYSVAIEVKEYRNGVFLGEVRRDVLLLVLNCPPNPPANLSSAGGSGNTNPVLQAGETTCFPLTFTDTQDSIYVTSFGDILDGTGGYTGPLATLPDAAGDKTVTTQFCWTPDCSAIRSKPYIFSVQARDNGCPYKTSTFNYSVKVDPFKGVNAILGDTFVCTPATKVYSVNARVGSSYAWLVAGGGTILSGQGTGSIQVSWPVGISNATVSVTETNAKGCTGIMNTQNIRLQQKPGVQSVQGDNIPCEKTNSIPYNVSNANGNTFTWVVSGGTIQSGQGQATINVNWGSSGSGWLKVVETTPGGCQGDTAVYNVSIRPKPTVDAGTDTKICEVGETVQLNGSGAPILKWNNDPTLSDINIPNPVAAPTVTTDYVLSGQLLPGGCIAYDTVRVNVYSKPVPNPIVGDTSVCEFDQMSPYHAWLKVFSINHTWIVEGGTLATPTNGPVVDINWGSKGTARIKMVQISPEGCVGDTNYMTVIIKEIPKVDAGPDTVICEGESLQLSGSGALLYDWQPANTLNNPSLANPIANVNITTLYTLKGYLEPGGCEGSDTMRVEVLNKPVMNIGPGDTICRGSTIELKVLIGTNFEWNTGDTTQSIFVSPQNTTTYWVLVRNKKCIFDTLKAVVFVAPVPTAQFTPSVVIGTEPLTVNFINNSIDADSFLWLFGDGIGRSRLNNPSYIYDLPGVYKVKMYARNNFGCLDSVEFSSIQVKEIFYYAFIPQIITPNGDGKNDQFEVKSNGYSGFSGEIFNRWGEKVYTWQNTNWWDATVNNKDASESQFYYVIEAEGRRGRKDVYKGSFTVLR